MNSPAHGYGAWIGIGYGEEVARTVFMEILSEDIKFKQSKLAKPSLRRVGQANAVSSKISVEGSIKLQATYDSLFPFLYAAMGGCVQDPNYDGEDTYKYDFSLEDELPELTIEVNRGYSQNFLYTGCQINKITLSQPIEDFLQVQVDIVGKNESMVDASSPVFFDPFTGIEWDDNSKIEVSSTPVDAKLTEFTVENGLATDRYKLGSRLRKGISRGDHRKVGGKLQFEFNTNAQYELYRGLTPVDVDVEWEGPVVGITDETRKLTITNPKCHFSGETPVVDNPGPVSVEMPFEALIDDDGGEEIQISLVSSEDDLIPT
jgi:hypothetical protein